MKPSEAPPPVPMSKTSPTRARPYAKPPARTAKEGDVVDESGWDVVYTDGSCTNNGGKGAKAGIGVWWGHDDPRFVSGLRAMSPTHESSIPETLPNGVPETKPTIALS